MNRQMDSRRILGPACTQQAESSEAVNLRVWSFETFVRVEWSDRSNASNVLAHLPLPWQPVKPGRGSPRVMDINSTNKSTNKSGDDPQ